VVGAAQRSIMKTIGYVDPDWSAKGAIEEKIRLDDAVGWSKRRVPKLDLANKPLKFELTETARFVFGRSVHLFSSIIA
jgi:hypothetical protein